MSPAIKKTPTASMGQKLRELAKLGWELAQRVPFKENVDEFDYHEWTLLKLLVLQQYSALYTSIISNYYGSYYYVDLYAGSGLGKLEGHPDVIVAGSPVVALAFACPSYDGAFFVDNKPQKLSLLKNRLKELIEMSTKEEYEELILDDLTPLRDNMKFYSGEANHFAIKIIEKLEQIDEETRKRSRKGVHALFFIDPFGLNFHWKSLERIITSKVRVDVIMFINTLALRMQLRQALRWKENRKLEALTRFWGDESWRQVIEGTKSVSRGELDTSELIRLLRKGYEEKIYRVTGGYKVVKWIHLPLKKSSDNRQFDILYITHKTKRGSPYTRYFDYMERLIEEIAKKNYYLLDKVVEYIVLGKVENKLIAFFDEFDEILNSMGKYSTGRTFGRKCRYAKKLLRKDSQLPL